MEIFNVHLFELLLIAGLALVVFGPERLPELGRMAGKQVARFLAWQQQFPELKLIGEVRSEFEQEIASLRDELVRTRRQIDLSREATFNSFRDELRPMLSLRDQPSVNTNGAAAGGSILPPAPPAAASAEDTTAALDLSTPIDNAPVEQTASQIETANAATAPSNPVPLGTVQAAARPNRLAPTAPTNVLNGAAPTAPSGEELRLALAQIERLSAELQSLVGALHERGLLEPGWQPDHAMNDQERQER